MTAKADERCRLEAMPACCWTAHARKHFPFEGMTREDTLPPNPARYLPGTTDAQVEEIERATVQARDRARQRGPKKQYVRATGACIGWDEGESAHGSYVECSGGDVDGRAFHGRPMHEGNRTWREFFEEDR